MGLLFNEKMTREEENAFIVEGAKRELAFYQWLIKDWLLQGKDYFTIKSLLAKDGLDTNNEDIFEQQVDLLGAYMGFTLSNNNGSVRIIHAWAFDETENYGRTELEIER